MEKSESKIHKLGAKADRLSPADAKNNAEREIAARTHDDAVRYVAVQQYDPALLADNDAIDLLELWSIVSRYKKVLFAVVLLALILATAVAVLTPPIYRAELIVAPATEEKGGKLSSLAGQFGGLASLAGVNLSSGGSDVNRILATLKSRAFLSSFLKEKEVINIISARLSKDELSSSNVYNYFVDNIIDVRKDNKTGLITLSVEWTEPHVAATWSNNLISQLNEHQRKNAVTEAERSIEYLNNQLQETGVVDMQQAIYRLIEAQTRVIMLANVKKEYALQVIDPAVAPEDPIYPRVGLIISLGVVLGFMLGMFLIFSLHAIESFKLRAKQTEY